MPEPNGAVLVAVSLSPEFSEVVKVLAEKDGRVFNDMVAQLAIEGAECRRRHGGK